MEEICSVELVRLQLGEWISVPPTMLLEDSMALGLVAVEGSSEVAGNGSTGPSDVQWSLVASSQRLSTDWEVIDPESES